MRRRRDLGAEIDAALSNPSLQQAVPAATRLVAMMRRQAVDGFPGYEKARERARAIKEDAIERLPELVATLEAAVHAAGGTVHRAVDAEDACRIITTIAAEEGCRRAVKSKSMTSEEIHLNAALEAAGIAVRETDLGEYIVQISGDRPSHIIAPILHKSLEDVRDAFRAELGTEDVPARPEELTQLARQMLRADFLEADLGITGANFLLADSGTVVIVENEGNARLCTQLPRVHVALAGIEKVLPGIAELEPFLELLPRSATGQLLTSYLTLLSGPGWGESPLVTGPRRFHLVLLDNGRTAMRDDPVLREALYCIRCGACLNACAPYQAVGGHVYGGPTYQSGIGNAWEAGVRGLEVAAEFNELCTTCARCRDVCPVRIDIPWMNAEIRGRIRQDEGPLVTSLLEEPVRLYRLARSAGPLRALVETPPVRALLQWRLGLDRRRRLPELPATTLTDWFDGREDAPAVPPTAGVGETSRERVVLWADCHTEHVDTGAGVAAVRVLETLGFEVEVVTGPCCGRAALSQGNIPEARRQARELSALLDAHAVAGTPIVALEPSCGTCVAEEYDRLLPGGAGAAPAVIRDIMAFLEERHERWAPGLVAASGAAVAGSDRAVNGDAADDVDEDTTAAVATTVVVHGHCQQKSAGWFAPVLSVLARVPGVQPAPTMADCCGMAGSFGYKSEGHAISMELGARLEGEIDRIAGPDASAPVCASGTSCRAQLRDLGRNDVRHPIELLWERLSGAGDVR